MNPTSSSASQSCCAKPCADGKADKVEGSTGCSLLKMGPLEVQAVWQEAPDHTAKADPQWNHPTGLRAPGTVEPGEHPNLCQWPPCHAVHSLQRPA